MKLNEEGRKVRRFFLGAICALFAIMVLGAGVSTYREVTAHDAKYTVDSPYNYDNIVIYPCALEDGTLVIDDENRVQYCEQTKSVLQVYSDSLRVLVGPDTVSYKIDYHEAGDAKRSITKDKWYVTRAEGKAVIYREADPSDSTKEHVVVIEPPFFVILSQRTECPSPRELASGN